MTLDSYPSSRPTATSSTMTSPINFSHDTVFVFKDANFLDIFMLSSIILSMIVSPMILFFFIRKYFCHQEKRQIDSIEGEVIGLSTECIGKRKRISIEEYLTSDEMETNYAARSAASSIDREYRADYIQFSHVRQQYRIGSINL